MSARSKVHGVQIGKDAGLERPAPARLVATMRKLLHAIFGMFKHDQLFEGHKFYAPRLESAPAPLPEAQVEDSLQREVLCP